MTGRATSRSCRPWRETVVYEAHLRGMTADPGSGVRGRPARDVRGLHREDPVPGRSRGDCCRAAPGLPVRPARRAGRAGQLLGLPAGLVLRPACGLRQPARPDRARGRIPRPGQGLPSGRARGHPRRGLQPHRRGRRERPDLLVPRPCQRRLLPPRRGRSGAIRRLQRDRQHAQCERPDRPPADPRQPALLGRGDARRRVPLRPRGDPVTRRGRRAADRSAGPVGDRDRSCPGRDQADRRGLGRRRPVRGRQLRRRPLGGVERALPRRRARLRQERPRHGPSHHGPAARQRRPVRPQAPGRAGQHQLRHLPRRLHARGPGLVRPQAQRGERRGEPRRQRPEPELELRGRRARRPIPRSSAYAAGRSGTF